MDFSFLLIFLIAATASAVLTVRSVIGKSPKRNPRGIAFATISIVGVPLLKPWAFVGSNEWQEVMVVSFALVAWTAFGSIAGGAVGRRMAGAKKKGSGTEAPDPSIFD